VNSNTPTPSPVAPESGQAIPFYCAQNYQTNDSVGYLMRRIISVLSHELDRELEPAGLTNAQWVPLLKLQNGCGSTVAELARGCDLDAGSMTRLLDRLEAKQFCRRVRSVEDRRVVNIELTPEGTAAAQEIPKALSQVQNAMLAGFSHEEWSALKGYLRRILNTVSALQAPTDHHDN
jgi:DNA-binding MarR family transcriptional regulator